MRIGVLWFVFKGETTFGIIFFYPFLLAAPFKYRRKCLAQFSGKKVTTRKWAEKVQISSSEAHYRANKTSDIV